MLSNQKPKKCAQIQQLIIQDFKWGELVNSSKLLVRYVHTLDDTDPKNYSGDAQL